MTLPTGAAFIDIALEQVDKKSPVDDVLMTSVAEDLYFLRNGGGSSGVFEFKVNGRLETIRNTLPVRRIDGAFVMAALTLSSASQYIEYSGTAGVIETDLRKYRAVNIPITGIDPQYSAAISSITRAGAAGATQSIAQATAQINTQSISYWKTQRNVQSIVKLAGTKTRYNLDVAPDADYEVGDYITFAGCTAGANNGTFSIVEVNQDGLANVVVLNGSGVNQSGVAGTADLQAMSYNLAGPASTEFVADEKALFAAHTNANNNGLFTIYAVNSGANNLVVKNRLGVTQGGVAGTIDNRRWTYTLAAAASSDLVVGETALFASHTSANNDGTFPITSVNSGGNNITVYNVNGVAQGGVAGSVNSYRWIYALPTDPTSSFSVGQTFTVESATTFGNNGTFTVVQINRLAANNLVVHNESGATQAGAAGTLTHTRQLVKFSADQSAIFSTASRVALTNVSVTLYGTGEHDVLEVNRGGGANYNVVIDVPFGDSQASPCGRVTLESRSVFSTRPIYTVTNANQNMVAVQNGVLDVTEATVAAGRMLALEILQIPTGGALNLTVHVK